MGIKNLQKLINEKAPHSMKKKLFTDYSHKTIAIDASIILYQFVIAIRSTGNDLKNKDGKITSHIHGILSKAVCLLETKIRPIFVFDGTPPELKQNVLNNRKDIRTNASDQISSGLLDEDEKIKSFKKSVAITYEQMNECKEILKLLGVPFIEADGEADVTCAYLSKNKLAYGVSSEDMDILPFGAEKLIRNLSPQKCKTDHVIEIVLEDVLKELELTYVKFVDLCILLGTDYNDTIPGIGMKRALDLIKKWGTIESLIENENKLKIPDRFDYKKVREYFMNPVVKTPTSFKWERPKYNELKNLLINKYSFGEEKIIKLQSRIKKIYSNYGDYEFK